ncbi:hypothetical protein BSL84_00945 [Streptomyces sp. TN58]|nr:hypothetical protein BSL84_00945 [Streptomyces sp. TN58]
MRVGSATSNSCTASPKLWADDRSWVLCTDCDLWTTKAVGFPALINALLNDSEIEAVRLPWAH